MGQAQKQGVVIDGGVWNESIRIFNNKMIQAQKKIVEQLCDDEVTERCGARYSPRNPGQPRRGGSDMVRLTLCDTQVPFKKPRIKQDGKELHLETLKVVRKEHEQRFLSIIKESVLRGVSTRKFKGNVDKFADVTGLSRSVVSRAFNEESLKDTIEINNRCLRGHRFVSILIDTGFYGKFSGHKKDNEGRLRKNGYALISALGVTDDGEKIFLGLQESYSENSAEVEQLLRNLVNRGLSTDQKMLFVLDGSPSLHKAVTAVFGDSARIQRCKLHKKRNIERRMAQQNRALFMAKQVSFNQRWRKIFSPKVESLEEAQELCDDLEHWLSAEGFDEAISSFREGRKQLLCAFELGLSPEARKSFMTTNLFESPAATMRESLRRVKLWRSPHHLLRWGASFSLRIEQTFNKVQPEAIQSLVESLDREDPPLTMPISA